MGIRHIPGVRDWSMRWRRRPTFEPRWDAIGTPIQPPTLEPAGIEEQLRAGPQPAEDGRDLACVVLSFKTQPGLAAAVESMLSQDVPVEIVVVNSGGGDPAGVLRSRGIQVEVIDRLEPLHVGAARNLGIAATHAPYVSFLAADCVAEPGWAGGRLSRHRAGALLVSSAVTNAYPDSSCAWAEYCLLHPRRMPGYPPQSVSHHGLSYARTIFEHFGTFREDLRVFEDTEFAARFRGMLTPVWAPDVQTAHRYVTTFHSLLADQFARGAQMARALEELTAFATTGSLPDTFPRERCTGGEDRSGRQPRRSAAGCSGRCPSYLRRCSRTASVRFSPGVAVDAEERLERTFRARAEIPIERAERGGHAACFVKLQELWDRPDRYRADGIWGSKLRSR